MLVMCDTVLPTDVQGDSSMLSGVIFLVAILVAVCVGIALDMTKDPRLCLRGLAVAISVLLPLGVLAWWLDLRVAILVLVPMGGVVISSLPATIEYGIAVLTELELTDPETPASPGGEKESIMNALVQDGASLGGMVIYGLTLAIDGRSHPKRALAFWLTMFLLGALLLGTLQPVRAAQRPQDLAIPICEAVH